MFSWAHLGFQVVLYLDEIFSAQDLSELCAHLTISAEARFGAVSVGTWKDMVFLYSPLFRCSVGEQFFFRQGRYFLQRRSEFHAFRIAWPTGLLGRVEVVEDFSRDTSPIFFPSSGWLGCGWSCSFGIFALNKKFWRKNRPEERTFSATVFVIVEGSPLARSTMFYC